MKTKYSRAGKSALSIVLAVMMIISTMLVGAVSVNAATNGAFSAGDVIYFDFTLPRNNQANILSSEYIASNGTTNLNSGNYFTGIEGIVTVKLSKAIDFNSYNDFLYKTNLNNWADDQSINASTSNKPTGDQNMVIVSADGKSYTWGTYDSSSGGDTSENTTIYVDSSFTGLYAFVPNVSNKTLFGEWGDANTSNVTNATESKVINSKTYKVLTIPNSDIGDNTFTMIGRYVAGETQIQTNDLDRTDGSTEANLTAGNTYVLTINSTSTDTNSGKYNDVTVTLYSSTEEPTTTATTEPSTPSESGTATIYVNSTDFTGLYVWETVNETDTVVFPSSGDDRWSASASNLKSYAPTELTGETNTYYKVEVTLSSATAHFKMIGRGTYQTTDISTYTDGSASYNLVAGKEYVLKLNSTGTINDSNTTKYNDISVTLYDSATQGAYKISTSFANYATAEITNNTNTSFASGTANKDDSISFNIVPNEKYTLVADSVKITYTETVTVDGTTSESEKTETLIATDGTYTFTMPAADVKISADFNIDKTKAYSSANCLWVDTQPDDVTTSPIALIKWTNKTGSSGTNGNNYVLYLPSGAGPTLNVYSTFNSLTIDGKTVTNGESYQFDYTKINTGDTYNVVGDGTTYTLKIYQSNSYAIYTTTTTTDPKAKDGNNLPTQSYGVQIDKVAYSGKFMSADTGGEICNELMELTQIKGRGNSSWKASGELYGKYAYNIKLGSKITPLDMTEATPAKSWCLLANNMDESSLRNVTVYEAAKKAGLANVPEYQVADLYNNGEYLGSYLLTEKVDVGTSKLVNGDTVDEHYDGTGTGDKIKYTYTYNDQAYEFQYVDTGNLEAGYSSDNLSYLLEFDLKSRAIEENCWFKTPKGQYVVVKAPEDVNEADMLFIIKKWVEVENTVYNGNYEEMNKVLDLDSFADVYLIQEFTKNLDSGATSYYVYWDGYQGGDATVDRSTVKWQATPIWDYDWALGGHGGTKSINTNGSEASNAPGTTDGWLTKYKYILQDDNNTESSVATTYNLQAQLANNTTFWNTNVKNAWNSDLYDSILSVYGTALSSSSAEPSDYFESCGIEDDYTQNLPSYNMNETRYGFIASNPSSTWGSAETGETVEKTYKYLKKWALQRAAWMSEKLTETVTVDFDVNQNSDGSITYSQPTVTRSMDTTYPLVYEYAIGDGDRDVLATYNEPTEYTTESLSSAIPDGFQLYCYVRAYYVSPTGDKFVKADRAIPMIYSNKLPILSSVSITASASEEMAGETITFTATPKFTNGTGSEAVTYVLYDNNNSEVATKNGTGATPVTFTVTLPSTAGTYSYYVKATYGETVKASSKCSVTVTSSDIELGPHNVDIYFKAPSSSIYTPSVTLNGETTVLTNDDTMELGNIYSGALKIVWWKATINIDSTKTNTLTFTLKDTDLNATITDSFAGDTYYIGVDNLVNGTEAVDLTSKPEYIRNFYLVPTHMVYQLTTPTDDNLGFTAIYNEETGTYDRYRMGVQVKANGTQSLSIDSVTDAQMMLAGRKTLSPVQMMLYDTNLDGKVDINDATLTQIALAN